MATTKTIAVQYKLLVLFYVFRIFSVFFPRLSYCQRTNPFRIALSSTGEYVYASQPYPLTVSDADLLSYLTMHL